MYRQRVDVRLPPELWARVVARAELLGQTRTMVVERALEQALAGQGLGDISSVASPRRSGSVKEVAPTEPPAPARASASPSLKRFMNQ